MTFKVVSFILLSLFLGASTVCVEYFRPRLTVDAALSQLENPSTTNRTYEKAVTQSLAYLNLTIASLWLVGTALIFRKEIKNSMKHLWKMVAALILFAALMSTGCIKPYHVPVLVDVDTAETPFVIELEDANKQATLKSKDFLKKKMVVSRRIEVPYRWKQEGYMMNYGRYIPSARVIIVDRQPTTREWTANAKGKDLGIWVESSDSVGFSTGISITARIEDNDDAVLFLHNCPPQKTRTVQKYEVSVTDLSSIMDGEIRTRIQSVFAEEAARYTMDDLRNKKREILEAVKDDVVPFFAERGITITTIGQFGGFEYENKDIQKAIDKVFEAQQDEEVAKAEAKAAEQRKVALQLIGEGKAAQKLEEARGEAEGIKLVADAKAYELEQLQKNPEAYIQLKTLEVEMAKLRTWDGKLPVYNMETGGNSSLLITPPKVGK